MDRVYRPDGTAFYPPFIRPENAVAQSDYGLCTPYYYEDDASTVTEWKKTYFVWIYSVYPTYFKQKDVVTHYVHKKYKCIPCDQNDTKFPDIADNEHIIDAWNGEDNNKSVQCTDNNGTVKEKRVLCEAQYQCVAPITPPPVCDETVGSYVSPRDGVFHEDIEVMGADFGLHYASNERNNTIAHGWTVSNHARLENDRLYLGSGSTYVVEPVVENGLSVVKFASNELTFDVNGTHLQTRDLYTKQTKIVFSYDSIGRLLTITDIYGQTSTLNRDTNGTLISVDAPKGQRTYLSIDSHGDLIEVQYEDTSSYVFEYERHFMTKETEPNGNVFLHFFDENGRVVKVIDAEQGEWLFNSATQSTSGTHTITRASGDVVTYKNHLLIDGILKTEKTLPTGDVVLYENALDDSSASTTTCGMQTTNIYKKENGVLYKDPYTNRRVLESSTVIMPSGLSKSTHYDKTYTIANSNVASIFTSTNTNNKLFKNLRDYANFTASSTTAQNKTSHIDYDKFNQNIQSMKPYGLLETMYTYDTQGKVTREQVGERVTQYAYNAKGKLESITDPLSQTTSYAYDSKDRLITTTYADGHISRYSYDANGNMIQLTTPTPNEHTFGYNGVNKRIRYNSPMGQSINYTYDNQRRITRVIKPSGASIETNYVNGRVESVVTPEGTTNYAYVCQNNVSSITKSGESFSFTYDGMLVRRMVQNGVLNQTLNYSYNNDFLVSSMTYAGTTNPYTYNNDGELTGVGSFSIARVLESTIKQTVSDATYSQTTIYNGYGEVTSQDDTLLHYVLQRNNNGQIIRKEETVNGQIVTYLYSYDERARLTHVNKDATEVEHYTYDANGNRATATVNEVNTTASYTLDDQLEVYGQNTYRYNNDGYLQEKVTPTATSTYAYNTQGALTQVNIIALQPNWHVYDNRPAGASITTNYDDTRHSNVIVLEGNGTNNGYRLGYSGEHHANSWKSTDKTIQWSMKFTEDYYVYASVMTTKGHRYLYYTPSDTDLGMQSNGSYIHHGLTQNSKNGTWQTFTRNLEADLKRYESDNELLTVNGFLVRGSGKVDDIATIGDTGQKTIKDNAEAQNQTISYQQNALNQRVAKLVDGEVVEKYLWQDLTTLLATYDKDDNLVQRFEYADSRMPVAMTMGTTKYYLHYDQVGSLRAISRVLSPDNTLAVVKEITYDTYGNILTDTNSSLKVPFGFAGGLYDSDTKLTRFGYRDYNAYTGKWTAKDPIGFDGGDLNLYGYVLNDPINFIDPTGEYWQYVWRAGKWIYTWISKSPKPKPPKKLPKKPKKNTWSCIGKIRYAPTSCSDCPDIVAALGLTKSEAQRNAKFTAPEHCRKFYGHFECHKGR